MTRPEEESYYQTLELDASANAQELARAYRRLKEIYSVDSPAVYGAYSLSEIEALQRRFEDAFATLADPERRRLYDEMLQAHAEGRAPLRMTAPLVPLPSVEADAEEPAREDVAELATADADYTGALLRRIRIARNLTLDELEERTKIARYHVRALEDEKWDNLPASLYVRGFLTNLARELRIPAARVLETYFPRLRAYYRDKARD